jgi:cytochrome c556
MIQMTKVLTIAVAALVCGLAGASAETDVIKQRKALMDSNGDATKQIVAMLKGAPFDLATVQAALKTYATSATEAPALFPDTSKTGGKTGALPAIWENKADFEARFVQFGKDTAAAQTAIVDAASFKQIAPGLLKNCGGCHEHYRAKE